MRELLLLALGLDGLLGLGHSPPQSPGLLGPGERVRRRKGWRGRRGSEGSGEGVVLLGDGEKKEENKGGEFKEEN